LANQRSLEDWLRHQELVHGLTIDLGLERVRSVALSMSLLPVASRCIIVAGTNGKGSTVACLAGILKSSGILAGSFTSPHLLRYNERIKVDGIEVADELLLEAFAAIDAARGATTLTFFEYNALAALWVFRARAVEFTLLEVGLGGRLDAVNIVDAEAAIVCSIGLDHADWLGTDIDAIGREKAGVFRSGQLAVLADAAMTPAVALEAQRVGARICQVGGGYHYREVAGHWSFTMQGCTLAPLPKPALPGSVQLANASAALATLHGMGIPGGLRLEAVSAALRQLKLPGRFQIVPGPIEWILDVAHNEPAARVLASSLASRPCAGRTWLVTGILGDKDINAIAQALAPCAQEWIVCGIKAPRGLTCAQLAARSAVFANARQAEDIQRGMSMAASLALPQDRIVVCGSFLAVAPALELLGLY
jgi:dihydrofolate synthase / folylpolyglutamate synthase